MKKTALASSNGSGGMTLANGSGGMTTLTNNLANISISDVEEEAEKENAINESLLAPIDDDDF